MAQETSYNPLKILFRCHAMAPFSKPQQAYWEMCMVIIQHSSTCVNQSRSTVNHDGGTRALNANWKHMLHQRIYTPYAGVLAYHTAHNSAPDSVNRNHMWVVVCGVWVLCFAAVTPTKRHLRLVFHHNCIRHHHHRRRNEARIIISNKEPAQQHNTSTTNGTYEQLQQALQLHLYIVTRFYIVVKRLKRDR